VRKTSKLIKAITLEEIEERIKETKEAAVEAYNELDRENSILKTIPVSVSDGRPRRAQANRIRYYKNAYNMLRNSLEMNKIIYKNLQNDLCNRR